MFDPEEIKKRNKFGDVIEPNNLPSRPMTDFSVTPERKVTQYTNNGQTYEAPRNSISDFLNVMGSGSDWANAGVAVSRGIGAWLDDSDVDEPAPVESQVFEYASSFGSMGSVFGPYGTAIGAGIGAVTGVVKGVQDQNDYDNRMERKRAFDQRASDIMGEEMIERAKIRNANLYGHG